MANTFRIPNLNSFRWRLKTVDKDPRYESLPFDDVVDPNCYSAKWKTVDRAQIQLLSDYEPTLTIHDYWSDEQIDDISIPEIDFNVLDVTFKCYQAEVVFAEYGEGDYYCRLTYNDGVNDIIWETSPLEVRDEQPLTLLFECTNKENDKDVIFDTGIVFNFRVEGIRDRKFLPKSANQLYTDQIYNVTQENSIPFRNFTIDIGMASGLPNWVIDKINLLFSLNQKKVDGTYYEKAEENSEFEPTRGDIGLNEDGWWSINVIPKINNLGYSYKTGSDDLNNDYKVVRESKFYENVADGFSIGDIFKTHTVLDYLKITNKSLAPFSLKLGTTNGGNEIGEYSFTEDLTDVWSVRHAFETIQTVYITLVGDVTIDVYVAYDQLDAKPAPVPVSGSGGFVKNTVYLYEELNDGDFENHWDIGTGLGKADTPFFGCAMSDGRNGTLDRSNQFIIGFDLDNPSSRDTVVGSNQITLVKANIPPLPIPFGRDRKAGNAGLDVISAEYPGPFGTLEKDAGGTSQPIDNRPLSRITVLFVKISD